MSSSHAARLREYYLWLQIAVKNTLRALACRRGLSHRAYFVDFRESAPSLFEAARYRACACSSQRRAISDETGGWNVGISDLPGTSGRIIQKDWSIPPHDHPSSAGCECVRGDGRNEERCVEKHREHSKLFAHTKNLEGRVNTSRDLRFGVVYVESIRTSR